MQDTGESTAAINKRADDAVWPAILDGLRDGARLRIVHTLDRAVLHGLPEDDPRLLTGRTLSASRVRRLAREGVLMASGTDEYRLIDDLDALRNR